MQQQQHRGRIAWSRSGLLAYIDGHNKVYVTWLQCKDGEQWGYVPPVHVQAASESRPVQLSWSTTNFDLAVADELGRVHIVSISPSGAPTNQIVASAVRDQRQRPAELDRLVGMHWLGSEKSLIIPRATTSETSKPWESVPPLGPFHPLKSRSALVSVNGNGMLRFLVQTPDYQYSEIDALVPGAYYVSHACFVQLGGDSLLVVLANGDGTVAAYEAVIKWQAEKLESKQDFVSVTVYPLAMLPLPKESQLIGLAAFRLVGAGSPTNEIIIRAVYRNCIVRYKLRHGEEALHPSFFQLFHASEPVPPDPYRIWRFEQEKIDRYEEKILEYLVKNTSIVTVFANGEVTNESLYSGGNRLQFDTVGLQYSPNKLLGIESSDEDDSAANPKGEGDVRHNITDICFSPTASCAAVFYQNSPPSDMPKLVSVEAKALDQEDEELNAESAKNIALALAVSYTCTVFNSEQCDDVLLVCWNVLHNPKIEKFTSLIFGTLAYDTQRLLNVQLTAPEDTYKIERLVVIPSPSQRWLSFLIALGTSSHWARTPGCHKALSLLQLQLLAFGLTWTLKRVTQKSRAQNVAQMRMEIQASQFHLASMIGPVRWATDFLVRVSQELYDACTSPSRAKDLLEQPNIYTALLLSGVSRYLIRYFLRGIRSLSSVSKNLAEQETRLNTKISQAAQLAKDPNLAVELRSKLSSPSNFLATRLLRKLATQLQSAPVKVDVFEKLLVKIDDGVKALVASASLSEDQRKSIESDLIVRGRIPEEMRPLVQPILEFARTTLFTAADVPGLYFYDTAWLGLDGVQCSEPIDGLRKRVILPREPTQVCTRCGMKSVATPDQTKQASQWLLLFQRHCICGGSWLREQETP